MSGLATVAGGKVWGLGYWGDILGIFSALLSCSCGCLYSELIPAILIPDTGLQVTLFPWFCCIRKLRGKWAVYRASSCLGDPLQLIRHRTERLLLLDTFCLIVRVWRNVGFDFQNSVCYIVRMPETLSKYLPYCQNRRSNISVQWGIGFLRSWRSVGNGPRYTVVPWYRGTVVQWYRGTVVQWYRGTVVPWYRAVYFSQWNNGGQNLVDICLRRDSNRCGKKTCFNGKGAIRYDNEAQ